MLMLVRKSKFFSIIRNSDQLPVGVVNTPRPPGESKRVWSWWVEVGGCGWRK